MESEQAATMAILQNDMRHVREDIASIKSSISTIEHSHNDVAERVAKMEGDIVTLYKKYDEISGRINYGRNQKAD